MVQGEGAVPALRLAAQDDDAVKGFTFEAILSGGDQLVFRSSGAGGEDEGASRVHLGGHHRGSFDAVLPGTKGNCSNVAYLIRCV